MTLEFTRARNLATMFIYACFVYTIRPQALPAKLNVVEKAGYMHACMHWHCAGASRPITMSEWHLMKLVDAGAPLWMVHEMLIE